MKRLIAATLAIALTGCATSRGTGANYTPIVDRPNGDYQQDLADCQAHADRVMSAGEGAMMGAAGGAVLGALFAMAVGGREFAGYGAKVGALSGAVGGAGQGEHNQRAIVSKCLASRGHSVLN